MLTAKQERFVQELVKGKSQREAYKASYNAERMKDATIDKRASEIFKKREIKGRYEELLDEASSKVTTDVAAIKQEMIDTLVAMMRADVGTQIDGRRVDGRAIKGYKYDTKDRVQYEFYDKIQAMSKLAELLGLNEDVAEEVNVILHKSEGYDV